MGTISADPYRSPFMGRKLQYRPVFRCLWTHLNAANNGEPHILLVFFLSGGTVSDSLNLAKVTKYGTTYPEYICCRTRRGCQASELQGREFHCAGSARELEERTVVLALALEVVCKIVWRSGGHRYLCR